MSRGDSALRDHSRQYCVDTPEGIRHLVDSSRAQRCDQHREQRHRWSDANGKRRKAGQPLLEWIPDPLNPQRRQEALRLQARDEADNIQRLVLDMQETIAELEERFRPKPESEAFRVLVQNLTILKTRCRDLMGIAERLR